MQNDLYYSLLVRGVFDSLSYNLVKNYGRNDNYLVKIDNKKIENEILADRYDYDVIDEKICEIVRKLFEEDECKINIIVYSDGDGRSNLYITIGEDNNRENMKVYSKIILDNNKIIKGTVKKKILKKLKNNFSYKNETYTNDEMLYFNDKYKRDKIKSIELTKDIYIPLDTPDEITFFYHNYRLIKMKRIQVEYAKYVISEINDLLEEIYKEKSILKYNGIELGFLDDIENKLFAHEESMMDINNQIMIKTGS